MQATDIKNIVKKHYLYKKAPKILLISHEFSRTGAPKVALILAQTLKKIYGISPIVTSIIDGAMKDDFRKNNIFVLDIPKEKFDKKFLEKISSNFDLIIMHSWCYQIFGLYTKKMPPMIWYAHEPFVQEELYPWLRQTIGSMFECWAGSFMTLEKMKKICPYRKTELLIYGIENHEIQFNKDDDKITFLLPASIEYRKGQDILIEAIKKIPIEIQNRAKFIIIGKALEEEFGKKIKEEIKNIACIEYHSEVNFEKLIEFYSKTNCIVVPSRFDPMPMIATYGLMYKKLCIVSDKVGTSKLIENNKNGIIFENENVEQLNSILINIIDNFDNYQPIANKGREIYEKYFSMENFEKEVEKRIKNVLLNYKKAEFKNRIQNFVLNLKNIFSKKNLQLIFSLKNQGKHKVMTFIGFKIKVKRNVSHPIVNLIF